MRYLSNVIEEQGLAYIFLSFVGITILISYSLNGFFLTEDVYFQSFGESLALDRIEKMIQIANKWQWLNYAFIPIMIFIRVSFTTICLYTGFFIKDIKVSFSKLFRVSLLSDFVFVIAAFVKLLILIFFKEVNTLEDLQFQPLSLLELFGRGEVSSMLIYPLSLLNFFELMYWIVLAKFITKINEVDMSNSFFLVLSSYGIGIAMWALCIMFITLNIS